MDTIKLSIDASFILQRVRLTWREALFGLENELIAEAAVVDLAVDRLIVDPDAGRAVAELAGAHGSEIRPALEALAREEAPQDDARIRAKWLFLVLAWILEHPSDFATPLQTLDGIYADFGYPEAIAHFVRYMPMVGPDLGSREANERRLCERWRAYVDQAAREYEGAKGRP